MLIQYKKPSFMGEASGLSKHKLYRVLGVVTPLEGVSFHYDKGICEVIVMEDEAYADAGAFGDVQFVPMSYVEVVDHSIPKDWKHATIAIPSSGGATVSLHSSPEFLNENFFVATYYSPGTTRDFAQKLRDRYEKYGKNIPISENQEDCREAYQIAERRVDRLIRRSLTDIRSVFDLWECSYYVKNISKAITARTNYIAETSNQIIHDNFAGKIIHYLMTFYFALNEKFVVPDSFMRICSSFTHFIKRSDKRMIDSVVKSIAEFGSVAEVDNVPANATLM